MLTVLSVMRPGDGRWGRAQVACTCHGALYSPCWWRTHISYTSTGLTEPSLLFQCHTVSLVCSWQFFKSYNNLNPPHPYVLMLESISGLNLVNPRTLFLFSPCSFISSASYSRWGNTLQWKRYGVQLCSGAMGKTDHGALLFPPPQFQAEQLPFYLFDILIWLCLRLALKKRFGNYKRFACKPPNSMRVSLCSCFSSDGTSSWIMETSHAIAGGAPSLHRQTPHYPPIRIRPIRRPLRRYL